jgi:hypothetical protein
MAAGRAR